MGNIKVILADDHALLRSCICELLHNKEGIYIIGEAENGKELVTKYFDLKPDVMVVDIFMPVLSGIDAIKRIKEKDFQAKALFLTAFDEEEFIYACFKSGGMGFITKNIVASELVTAIKQVFLGKEYFGNSAQFNPGKLIHRIKKNGHIINVLQPELTPREKKILSLISKGLTSKEIAENLYLSKRTIDTYRSYIMKKLNIHSLPEFIKYSIEFSNRTDIIIQSEKIIIKKA